MCTKSQLEAIEEEMVNYYRSGNSGTLRPGCDRITQKSEGAGNGSAGDLQFQRIRTGGNGADARRGCGCLASRF